MTTLAQLDEMIAKNRPRPFNLDDPEDLKRLYRETEGFLKTCHHKHGTDWEGRRYAIEALEKLGNR